MRLAGKTALITGAGSGIGRAASVLFAREGARLALFDRRSLSSTVAEVESQGAEAVAYEADVGDSAAVSEAVADVCGRLGGLSIVVANAGINRDAFVQDISDEAWDEVLRVNLGGCFHVCRAAFAELGEGSAIVMTSSVSIRGNLGQANYAASKAGVVGLTRALALEGAPRGIRVNAVAPGFTDTPMVESIPEKVRAKLLSRIPMNRMAEPEEIARAMLFLASEDASYITGQTLFVDGGAGIGV